MGAGYAIYDHDERRILDQTAPPHASRLLPDLDPEVSI